jgi:hypothetical protein
MRLRSIVAGGVAMLVLTAGRVSAANLDPVVLQPVTEFIRAINTGDTTAFPRIFTAALVNVPAGRRIKPACFAKQSDTRDASRDGE